MNQKIIGTLLVATSMLTHIAFSLESMENSSKECSDKNNISLLFVQEAKHATLYKISKNNLCYNFTIWPASNKVHYFSEEPAREAGELTTKKFITLWQNQDSSTSSSFKPNVAIEGDLVSNGKFVKIYNSGATLSNIRYSVKNNSITYTACPISNGNTLKSADLRNVTVFIDNEKVGFTPWPPS